MDDAVNPKPSRVRLYTLIGGLTGVVTGYALTLWMANDWQIMIGGKPYSSIPPYTIIAFELTILFGGLMTVLGLFIHGKLPSPRHAARCRASIPALRGASKIKLTPSPGCPRAFTLAARMGPCIVPSYRTATGLSRWLNSTNSTDVTRSG